MTKKMTKKEMFAVIANAMADNAEVVEFCNHEIELLSRKRSKSSKPTAKQIENEGIKAEILEVIADGHARTAKEIGTEVGYSTAKVSALLRALVLDGKAEKIPGAKSKDAPTYIGKE